MAARLVLNGLAELRGYLSTRNPAGGAVFILFTGSKDEQSGKSWCPDCNVADPVIEHAVNELSAESVLITCFVGDRPTWKNSQNEFRLDKEFQLKAVPTLVHWKQNKKLVEEQCTNESLVKMFFEED